MSKVDDRVLKLILLVLSSLMVVMIITVIVVVINKQDDGDLAKACLQAENDGAIMDCLDEKAYSYYEEGDCEKALKVYDDVPADRFDEYTLSDIYQEAYALSDGCKDKSLRKYWLDKYSEATDHLEGRD